MSKIFTRSRGRSAALGLAVLAAIPATAEAVHWPFFGGDNGRSGYQPVDEGRAPIGFRYAKTDPSDRFLKTSILTSTGIPLSQRVIYGTVNPMEVMAKAPADANGRVHLRILETGAPLGPPEGVKVDNGVADADVFGPGAMAPEPASVSFVETSGPNGLGQVFAVHNDDDQSPTGDISVAQIDETSGRLVQDEPLAGTDGFSIRSSAVATGPLNEQGDRVLFFVAESGDDERLFRVPIGRAGSAAATIGAVTSTPDVNADPQASPTLVFLRGPDGAPRPLIAVGTGAPDNQLKTFAAADLTPGPASGNLGGSVQTPSVPVQPNGMTPNPSTPVTTAAALHVAVERDAETVVHTLAQSANKQALATLATSPVLSGAPAPALATTQEAEPEGLSDGKVIVTTAANLYLLETKTLRRAGALSATPLRSGTTGFSQTTAAASGKLIFVTNDEGRQLVLRLSDAQPVPPAKFRENRHNAAPRLDNSGMGQPSISRRFVQFGSQKGLFVYRARPTSRKRRITRIRGTATSALPGDVRTLTAAASNKSGRERHARGRVEFRHEVKASGGVSQFRGHVTCFGAEQDGFVEITGRVSKGRTAAGANLAGRGFAFSIRTGGSPQRFSLPRFERPSTLLPCSGGRTETVPVTRGGFALHPTD